MTGSTPRPALGAVLVAALAVALAGLAHAQPIRVDIDSTHGGSAIVTESGWVSLDATGGNGSAVTTDGVTFTIYTAAGSRNRSGPSDLTRDFVYDAGANAAVGVIIDDLPAGTWQTKVWSWDDSFPTGIGDQTVGFRKNASGPPPSIVTTSAAVDPVNPVSTFLINADGTSQYRVWLRENNSQNRSRLNAIALEQVAAPTLYQIDIDSTNGGTPIATQAGWTSLDATDGNGSVVYAGGAQFVVFSADGSRNRSGPNALTRDFVYDDGGDAAVGLTIRDLPPGRWKAEVWAWDNDYAAGDQIVGLTEGPLGGFVRIITTSAVPDPVDPISSFTFSTDGISDYHIFTRENNSANATRFNALRLTALPAPPFPGLIRVDIDAAQGGNPIATAPGFVSLDATSGNDSWVDVNGVVLQVFGTAGSRNRGGSNHLTGDFIFDGGSGQDSGVRIYGLPDGIWEASVWAWDNSFPTTVSDQIVGITQFGAGDEILFTDSFAPDPDDPFTFRFDSTGLPNGFGIFTRENNQWNRSRFNAIQLSYIPEPTTLALLGLGALALVRRRRK